MTFTLLHFLNLIYFIILILNLFLNISLVIFFFKYILAKGAIFKFRYTLAVVKCPFLLFVIF